MRMKHRQQHGYQDGERDPELRAKRHEATLHRTRKDAPPWTSPLLSAWLMRGVRVPLLPAV